MNLTPEWITVMLLALGMILGGFAWAISFFASKTQIKDFKEMIESLKKELGVLKKDIEVLFANTLHYQKVIEKNAQTMESVEGFVQRIEERLPSKKKKAS